MFETLKKGADEFNRGRFWEAHEHWESVWKTLPQPEKGYVQALIQVAAAFHLSTQGREFPARSLALAALEKLALPGMAEVLKQTPRIEIPGLEAALRDFVIAPERVPRLQAKSVEAGD